MKDESTTIDIGKELRKQERRQKVEAAKNKIKNWWENNKGYVVIFGPAVLGGALKIGQQIARRHNIYVEEREKDLRLYDTSLGHYWRLRRKLDNRDWLTINRRREEGESLGEILDEMRVLK